MLLLHSSLIPDEYIKGIDRSLPGISRLAFRNVDSVYPSIASHPDIFFFQLTGNTLIHSPSVPEEVVSEMTKARIRLIPSEECPHGAYPATASLNAVRVGGFIFHNSKITDGAITRSGGMLGLKFVHTNQGYARCSVIPVGDNALITADAGIAEAAQGAGLDVLVINPGNVTLQAQESGFIGGATGLLPDGRILFLGDITQHPDSQAIDAFLQKHRIASITIERLPLYDAGSLICID